MMAEVVVKGGITEADVALFLSSLTQGWIVSAIENRIKALGGRDKAISKQGLFVRKDPGLSGLEAALDGLYLSFAAVEKELEKDLVKLVSGRRTNAVYDMAAVVVDETDRIIDAYLNGDVVFASPSDGYRTALDDMEELMFKGRLSREAALKQLRAENPYPQDLRESVDDAAA